jgi:H+/Cl- antiporter ClcA/SAM-dependent methyltransferase/CBS domain-containing protein
VSGNVDRSPSPEKQLPTDAVVGRDERARRGAERRLGDFTTSWSILQLVPLAAVIGVLSAVVALVLLDLIGLITNLVYYHRYSLDLISPAANTLGVAAIAVPVVGGLIVGVMARYGSEQIRGHGIPEAMETILVGGSKVQPRLTILKPISSAISIGTGGPFGAEGPIILTGGALASVIAQFFNLSASERRSLLVAGAAGGMAAVFGTPVAAVLLGVELLVFEWKPRSMILIGIAAAVAEGVRMFLASRGLIAPEPLFPTHIALATGWEPFVGAMAVGLAGGAVAWVLTVSVYGAEDAFKKLPIHWMWWPAIGGVVVGLGGLIEPRALGVGYDTIASQLAGDVALGALVSIFVVKLIIWSIALGSGTSGGILAPILIMGCAMGGVLTPLLPSASTGYWILLGMTAALAGVTRSPLTAVVFSVELTHDVEVLMPLLVVSTIAHLVSVLVLKRSILTEKVARRGFHVLREYEVGPLEALFVRDVMATDLLTVEEGSNLDAVYELLLGHSTMRYQRLLPVMSSDGRLVGALSWNDVLERAARGDLGGTIDDVMHRELIVAYADETLRGVADRMADSELGVLPVVERERQDRLRGLVSQFELLRARGRMLEEERHREQVLELRVFPIPIFRRHARRAAGVRPSSRETPSRGGLSEARGAPSQREPSTAGGAPHTADASAGLSGEASSDLFAKGSSALPADVSAAVAYEKLLVPALLQEWAPRLADAAQIGPGDRVLDIACGTGVLAREVARRVGDAGSVAGLDASTGMLAVAERLAPDISWRHGSAESLPFPDHCFDVVVSQFGLMFFADPGKALREMLRVLRPEGRLAVAVWGSLESMPAYTLEVGLVERIAGERAGRALRLPFALGDQRKLEGLLEEAGIATCELVTLHGRARFPNVRSMVEADLRGWLPAMGVVLPEERVSEIMAEAEAVLGDYLDEDGRAVFESVAHIATGRKL